MTNQQPTLKSLSKEGSHTYRTEVRLKPDYHDDLIFCRSALERETAASISNSMIFKRAIRIYRHHLEGLKRQPQQWALEVEAIHKAR